MNVYLAVAVMVVFRVLLCHSVLIAWDSHAIGILAFVYLFLLEPAIASED